MMNRSVRIDGHEFNDTSLSFSHVFGNYVAPASGFHELFSVRGYDPNLFSSLGHENPYSFGQSKEKFIKGLQAIIKSRVPIDRITYIDLQEMIDIAMGDWWDIATIEKIRRSGEELRTPVTLVRY